MNYRIREIKENEYGVLFDFLYESIYIQKGTPKPPRQIIELPELNIYVADFGKPEDYCLVAEVDNNIVGAVWARIMDDYGHIDNQTPSLAMSLYKKYRNLGIGTALLNAMLKLLKSKGYNRVSLSVQTENFALKMYQKAGFKVHKDNGDEWVMVIDL